MLERQFRPYTEIDNDISMTWIFRVHPSNLLRGTIFLIFLTISSSAHAECWQRIKASLDSKQVPDRTTLDICRTELGAWYDTNEKWIVWVFGGIGAALPLTLFTVYAGRRRQAMREAELITEIRKLREELDKLKSGTIHGVPEGVQFSSNILQLPVVSWVFDRSLWIQHCQTGAHPVMHAKTGEWVDRGAPLFSFPIRFRSAWIPGDNTLVAVVNSPASGILLGGMPLLETWPLSILLPEDEPPPTPVEDIFRDLCRYCEEHMQYIYLDQEEFKGNKSYTRESIRYALNAQRNADYKVVDVWYGYRDHIRELMSKKPGLRRLLPKEPPEIVTVYQYAEFATPKTPPRWYVQPTELTECIQLTVWEDLERSRQDRYKFFAIVEGRGCVPLKRVLLTVTEIGSLGGARDYFIQSDDSGTFKHGLEWYRGSELEAQCIATDFRARRGRSGENEWSNTATIKVPARST